MTVRVLCRNLRQLKTYYKTTGMLASVRDRRESGAIAQLGERCNGIAEVGGSIPPGSTKISPHRLEA